MQTAAYRATLSHHTLPGNLPAWLFTGPDAPSDAPLVFVLHGMLSRKERHLDLCLRLATAGFRAVAFDAPHHGDRSDEHTPTLYGDRTAAQFLQTFAQTVQQSVRDARTLADYFNASRYGLVGHSMGGYIAVQIALSDSRAQAVVNVGGSIEIGEAGGRVPPLLSYLAQLSPQVAEALQAGNLAGRAGELYPRPVLLLHGDQDPTVPIGGARRFHQALRTAYQSQPERALLREFTGAGHEFSPQMAEEAVGFLREFLL